MQKEINPKLKAKIIEAVPSIMFHTIGCIAEDKQGNRWDFVGCKFGWWCKSGELETIRSPEGILKIIGRTITFCDILLTWAKFCRKNKKNQGEHSDGVDKILLLWNKKNNDLSQQSPVLIKLLEKILL